MREHARAREVVYWRARAVFKRCLIARVTRNRCGRMLYRTYASWYFSRCTSVDGEIMKFTGVSGWVITLEI